MIRTMISKRFFAGKFVAVSMLLFCIAAAAGRFEAVNAKNANAVSYTSADFSDGTSLTMAKYKKLKNRMTYKQVTSVLGKEGDELSRTTVGSTKIATYKWQGNDYEYIFCNFTNGKLTFKSQANLK